MEMFILKCYKFLVVLNFVLIQNISAENLNKLYLEKVLKNVNTSVDPCDDFYQFACGNWVSNYVSEHYLDMPGYMDYLVNQQLIEILNSNQNKSGIYNKLRFYYESCRNLSNPTLSSYLKLTQSKLGFQWPIFRENWNHVWENETNFDWLSTVAHLRLYGLNGVFLTQHINVRLTNGSHYLLEVHQHQSRLELKLVDILEIFKNFGMNEIESKRVSEKIVELEERMKNLTNVEFTVDLDEDDSRYKNSFQELTVVELMTRVPQIDWRKYFNIVLERDVNSTESIQTFALNVDYFTSLISVLKNTSNETICYYIMLKFMYQLNEELPISAQKSMECIKHLRGYMPLAINFLYEEHLYKTKRNSTDAALLQIFENLRNGFQRLLEENFLKIDSKEQNFILDELKTMKFKIGNIPAQVNRTFVEDYYKDVDLNATNFYSNHLQLIKLSIKAQYNKLRNIPIPIDQQFYEYDPETARSSSPVKIFDNAILVPYGYLQLPLFDSKLHSIFQYSLFGFIIAHEIIHAYDLFHIVYDQYGNYNDIGVSVAHHFWKHVDCFAQYPSDSLSENVADVAGLRLAYQTYFDDVAINDLHENGTSFTSQQLFFINSVQFLCANMAKISLLDTKMFNLEHEMHDVRVRRNWAHFEQFAIAFKCRNNSVMHPDVKCRLW